MNKNPIGLFDSGVGGTSIWKEIIQKLPYEDTIYLADSKNAPYGEKTKQEIIEICIKNTEYLISKGAKIIVVACNTATTNAIDVLRSKYNIPFIGIEPAIKPAALATQTKAIGILATKGTLSSDLFHNTSHKFTSDITLIEQEGTGLVNLIEQNKIESLEMEILLKKYLNPMIQKNIDYLVLGCSHYPYLIPRIEQIINSDIQIIDSGLAVAKQTKKILLQKRLINNLLEVGSHILISNSNTNTLSTLTKNIKRTTVKYYDF